MKNKINWFWTALIVGIGFSFAGCWDGSNSAGIGNNYFIFDSDTGTITGYHSDGPKNVILP